MTGETDADLTGAEDEDDRGSEGEDDNYDEYAEAEFDSDEDSDDEWSPSEAQIREEELQREKEPEVPAPCLAVKGSLRLGKGVPIGPITHGIWHLYPSEYFLHIPEVGLERTRTFGHKCEEPSEKYWSTGCRGRGRVYGGELAVYPRDDLFIKNFKLPTRASLSPVVAKCWRG
jgi:hypothetical protein